MASPPEQIVIVGAGLAGLRAAEGARLAGFSGRIVLIGDETHAPYDRPPLSKAVLLNDGHEHEIGLAPGDFLAEHAITLKLGSAVRAIDRGAHTVRLANGETVVYDRLVLATGSRVRTLPLFPQDARGVHYMRGLDDALKLRRALAADKTLAIIGAGVIGLEVAASARELGCGVTVIETQERVMARNAAPVVSDYFERRHRAEGVDIRLGVTAAEAALSGDRWRLGLSDGAQIEAGVVVVGVGVLANTDLARDCGLEVRGEGIVVDAQGRSSDEAIYAAGEVTMHYNTRYARHERQETWAHAAEHGAHVGRALIAPSASYEEISSFWSDQYDINLQVVGAPMGEADIVRGDPASGKFVVFHVSDGCVTGVSAINSVRELRAAKKLVGLPAPGDLTKLADPAQPLTALTA